MVFFVSKNLIRRGKVEPNLFKTLLPRISLGCESINEFKVSPANEPFKTCDSKTSMVDISQESPQLSTECSLFNLIFKLSPPQIRY